MVWAREGKGEKKKEKKAVKGFLSQKLNVGMWEGAWMAGGRWPALNPSQHQICKCGWWL